MSTPPGRAASHPTAAGLGWPDPSPTDSPGLGWPPEQPVPADEPPEESR